MEYSPFGESESLWDVQEILQNLKPKAQNGFQSSRH